MGMCARSFKEFSEIIRSLGLDRPIRSALQKENFEIDIEILEELSRAEKPKRISKEEIEIVKIIAKDWKNEKAWKMVQEEGAKILDNAANALRSLSDEYEKTMKEEGLIEGKGGTVPLTKLVGLAVLFSAGGGLIGRDIFFDGSSDSVIRGSGLIGSGLLALPF